MGTRSQAQRDAMTVEIAYALTSAAVAAALVLGALAGPVLLFDLPGGVDHALLIAATVLVPLVFGVRVVSVLVRYQEAVAAQEERTREGAEVEGAAEEFPQPSQPGRTSPDS
ncbi:DUF6332 family protein [Streptomyces monticola]|uniref:DUF6332 family protein n=1 Tax=Streptomyces monticola TaxID=2666263 RepID=A0ABW2JQ57_9ACTN